MCMKTTVEIPDSLLEEAKRLASCEGTTVRALVEEGLRRTLAERKRAVGFRLRKATFKGTGMQPALEGASWDQIRDAAYEGRGG
jgi:Arc/MetJ family transcription regulator